MVIQDEGHHDDVVEIRSGRMQHGRSDTYLHVFETVLSADHSQHVLFAALLHLTGQQQLVEYEVGFLEVEDDIELADVAIVFVHLLHVAVNNFERDQLIVCRVGGGDEEQRGISAVHHFRVCGDRRVRRSSREDSEATATVCGDNKMRGVRDTFVLEKVAHASPSRQNQLGDIFDDLRLILRRESREPFGKSLGEEPLV